jgi:hypothetical protein
VQLLATAQLIAKGLFRSFPLSGVYYSATCSSIRVHILLVLSGSGAVYAGPPPSFQNRGSVGPLTKLNYEHPWDAIPVPLSSLNIVPYLSA